MKTEVNSKTHTKLRVRIMVAARKKFSKKGYSKTSMDDIANAAHVSKGGLYHHFESKEKLFIEIINQNQEPMGKLDPGLFKKRENLLEDLGKYYDSLNIQQELMKIWLEAMTESAHNSKLNQAVRERRRQMEELATRQLKHLKSTIGLFRNSEDSDLYFFAKGILALIKGCALDRFTGDDPDLVRKTWMMAMYAIITSTKGIHIS